MCELCVNFNPPSVTWLRFNTVVKYGRRCNYFATSTKEIGKRNIFQNFQSFENLKYDIKYEKAARLT